MIIDERKVRFKAVRSGGPGGQRANRRSTKVELWVKVGSLPITEIQKKKLRIRLAHHLNKKDELWIQDQEERTQELNREKALRHLNKMIEEALYEPPKRIKTAPSRRADERRIKEKKIISDKKKSRRF